MGRPLSYDQAREILDGAFPIAEALFENRIDPGISPEIVTATERLFSSSTQAFREALVGVTLARIIDPGIDIRFPYMNQGDAAFNGRTLDNAVVNPFLVEHEIPCSTGPYLSVLRRNVTFEEATAKGIRDKAAFHALLQIIDRLLHGDSDAARHYLHYLLSRFLALRDASNIPLARVHRLSLEQHEALIERLLMVPSGGLIPVLLSVGILNAIRDQFGLPWDISWQGINVADRATGAGGDITIERDGYTVMAIEVTERPIDRSRVMATFTSKISPAGIEDYLFLFTSAAPGDDARSTARQYFAQGHDMSFINVKEWTVGMLGAC
jgi:hypothetical protein